MSDHTERPWCQMGLSIKQRASILCGSPMTEKVFREAISAAISQALADAAPKWIAVSEALPEIFNDASNELWLVSPDISDVVKGFLIDNRFYRIGDFGGLFRLRQVTHWQYVTVPAAPKED